MVRIGVDVGYDGGGRFGAAVALFEGSRIRVGFCNDGTMSGGFANIAEALEYFFGGDVGAIVEERRVVKDGLEIFGNLRSI